MEDHDYVENLVVVEPPTFEVITLAQAKIQCRVDTDVEDELITDHITTAREMVENHVRRTLLPTIYELRLSNFPRCNDYIELLKPPLIRVIAVKYIDGTGTLNTLDPSLYTVDFGGEGPGIIMPKSGWPSIPHGLNAVRITYLAGYGPYVPLESKGITIGGSAEVVVNPPQPPPSPPVSPIPACARSAVKLLVGDLYMNREASSELNLREIPIGIKRILAPLRWRYQV